MAFKRKETIREVQAEARRLTLKRLREAREEQAAQELRVEYNDSDLLTPKEAKEQEERLRIKEETIEQTLAAVRGEQPSAVYDETKKDSPSKGQAAAKGNARTSSKGGK